MSIVTEEVKKEVLRYLNVKPDCYKDKDDGFYLFYKRCMDAGMHYADADRYAILNTLLGYDIGRKCAQAINGWMYEHDEDIYELDADEDSKKLLQEAAQDLALTVDFSHWATEQFTTYKFFENTASAGADSSTQEKTAGSRIRANGNIRIDTYYDVTCRVCGFSRSTDFSMGMETCKARLAKQARKEGWVNHSGLTLCPNCAAAVQKELSRHDIGGDQNDQS